MVPLAVGLIVLVDRRIWKDDFPLPAKAVADESAHLAMTMCLLTLLARERSRDFYLGATFGSVALDLDHVPPYARGERPRKRPHTHSFPVVVLAFGAGALTGGRRRAWLQGATFGLVSHLLRDLLTGGAPLLWPLSARTVRLGRSGLPSRRGVSR
jgi:membrane-bound metal-dependent hydrolase YbcI (DUF457 family)